MQTSTDRREYLSTREVFSCCDGSRCIVVDGFLYAQELFSSIEGLSLVDGVQRSSTTLLTAEQTSDQTLDDSPLAARRSACFFLTHFHSDHYMGLRRAFSCGPIFCSNITARLVLTELGVSNAHVRPLEVNVKYRLDVGRREIVDRNRSDLTAQQVDFMFVDANHCPGAVMIVFWTSQGILLHTGDFRFSPEPMTTSPPTAAANRAAERAAPRRIAHNLGPRVTSTSRRRREASAFRVPDTHPLSQIAGKVDRLFLDNTYCDDRYELPTQSEAIQLAVAYVTEAMKVARRRIPDGCLRVAVLFGTYTIGKERLAMGCRDAIAADAPIFASAVKLDHLRHCELVERGNFLPIPQRDGVFPATVGTPLRAEGRDVLVTFFLVPMAIVSERSLRESERTIVLPGDVQLDVTQFSTVLAITPTGWSQSRSSSGTLKWLGTIGSASVPYSEHSSFSELLAFVRFIQPRNIVPTVSAKQFTKYESRFCEASARMTSKAPKSIQWLLSSFARRPQTQGEPRVGVEEVDSTTGSDAESEGSVIEL